MQAILKVVGGKNNGREIKIGVPEFYIGRGEKAHLRPSSDLISRMHCVIRLKDGKVEIEDLQSRNGSFVNEKQLTGVHQAKSGDRLRVGRLNFEVVIDPVKAGNKKPKVKDVAEAAARTAAKPKTAGNADIEESISDWLAEPDEGPLTGSFDNETVFAFDEPDVSVDSLNEANEAENAALEAAKEAEKEEEEQETAKKKGKKEYGKLPPMPKFSHEDSTSAAGDVLKKFFNRR